MLGDQLRASALASNSRSFSDNVAYARLDVSEGASAFPGERCSFQFRSSWPPQRQRADGH